MGIFDALRGRRSDGKTDDQQAEIGPDDPAAPEPMQFQPRTDGIYLAGSHCLQFGAGRVREATGLTEADAARVALTGRDVRSGEYTPSGRFSLSAPFEMLVAFTVLETGDDFFVARRTSAQDRSSAELRYLFVPPPAAG